MMLKVNKEDKCPACQKLMLREIEKDEKGGFQYILKCPEHGIMRKYSPSFKDVEEFNA